MALSSGAVMLTFDDGRLSAYTQAFPYMCEKGILGTGYVIGERIGWARHATPAQLKEMDSAGWSIANHTQTHPDLTLLAGDEVQIELSICQDALRDIGLTRASSHVAYPFGKVDGSVQAELKAAGMLTGRTVQDFSQAYPVEDWYRLNARMILAATTLEMAMGYVDEAGSKGEIVILVMHDLTDTPETYAEWTPANFRALVDYIMEREIQTLTINDLYEQPTTQTYRISIRADVSIERMS